MIELAGIEPGAQKKIMVGGMRIGNYSFKLLSMPFQGAKSGSFLGPIGAPFWAHFWVPFGGQFWPKHKGNNGFWSFHALKRIGFDPFLGSILDTFGMS